MEQVQAYRATDGALFTTADACQEHEFSLIWRTRIDEFIQSDGNPYRRGAHAGMAMKLIIGWERFKTGA